ncbi:Retrovirus-related Pol polyprotein from transposon TNT 1-94 [Araneus ventricosus]|uniref:Retrovirus-related Pol polyprotein from transposon TNT 1-94 n=1 Tax=Araneus ventricosus TaxID=182803 RepID=A0A4Y2PN26_ARAVE|nr:Retrovirus-related Pol polyprotein from transposon TNT 1-94 [Araneus ventricosus]
MEYCKTVSTPILEESTNIEKSNEQSSKTFPYREAVGTLMHFMIGTRPDVAYCVVLSRHLENPSTEDWITVKRVFSYIAGSYDKGIVYKHKYKPGLLECFSDADFRGCKVSGRSTSGVVILNSGGAISWFSQRQSVVATSTTEAETIDVNKYCREIIWLKRLFSGVTKLNGMPVLQVDKTAIIRLAQNTKFHRPTKHIRIKLFFLSEKRY